MSAEEEVIAATTSPATTRTLVRDLQELGLALGNTIIVHSSLSSLGFVAGGAHAVVEALFEAVGPLGTVVMPTQSGQLTDPAGWSNPPVPKEWVSTLREATPPYDPHLTPTRQMGQVVELFRRYEGTIRSSHPAVSLAAHGPQAAIIVEQHPLGPSLGEGSPLGKLYELDAGVLLLGVSHLNNTSLHLAEARARWPGKKRFRAGAPMLVDGHREWVFYDDVEADDSDFEQIGDAFAETGNESSGAVGIGVGRLCSQRAVVDFAVDWIEANRV